MGAEKPTVSEIVLQKRLRRTADKRETERIPCRHERAGGRNVFSVGKRTRRKGRYHGKTQNRKPDALGAADERCTGNGNGNCQ